MNRSAEYHLYYSALAGPLVHKSCPGDLLIVAKRRKQEDSLVIILAEAGSTYERQLLWLFGLDEDLNKLDVRHLKNGSNREVGFAAYFILDALGIEVQTADEKWLEIILSKFGESFPSTSAFSDFARKTLPHVNSKDDPDAALMAWIEHETMLFQTLERHLVSKKIENGFKDVDEFISFSLSVQNRRKSRAGHALEHHLEFIFSRHEVMHNRGAETENKTRPDFIFPDITVYHNPSFKVACLSMLGVKHTCKDRWRQVLSEANRINTKHLLTLEPGISENQTNEMKANNVVLVLPEELHSTYTDNQQNELVNLIEFLTMIKDKQRLFLSGKCI